MKKHKLKAFAQIALILGLVMAQQPPCVETTFVGQDWCLTTNAVVSGNNVEYLTGMTRESCVQACIDAQPPAKNYDCWSVEYIANAGNGATNCRT